MTDAEHVARIRRQYRGLQGDMPPFGDVITLLRVLDAAAMALSACRMRLANDGIPEPPELDTALSTARGKP